MKAAILHGLRDVRIEERPDPEPGTGEVLVRVKAVGVCGSDVHYYARGRIGNQIVKEPQSVGHEFMGVVERAGEGVRGIEPGARVAIEPGINCRACRLCDEGRPNLCQKVIFYGTPPVEGAFQEYVTHPARLVFPLPENVSDIEGALLEPLGIGIHAVGIAGIETGDRIAIFGSGPIGLSVALAARASGATGIYMTDVLDYRCEFANRFVADGVANPRQRDVVAWLKGLTGGEGVDVTFECAGQQECVEQCISAVRVGGRTALVGIPVGDRYDFDTHVARRKELALRHVRRSCFTVERGLRLLASGQVRLKDMATHTFPFERVKDAFETVDNHADGVVKAVVLL